MSDHTDTTTDPDAELAAAVAENCRLRAEIEGWREYVARQMAAVAAKVETIRERTAPPTEWDGLRALAAGLKRVERLVVETLADGRGAVPLTALADVCEWDDPPARWKDTRRRLAPKLAAHGWTLRQKDGRAVAEKAPN